MRSEHLPSGQPPGPSQTKHQQIHNYPFETDDFVERQIRNSFFRRYAIFFYQVKRFCYFHIGMDFSQMKKKSFSSCDSIYDTNPNGICVYVY